MASKRTNLREKAERADRAKFPLGLPTAKSEELRGVLLEIHRLAMQAFDCLEEDMISQHDIFSMLRLPVEINYFAQVMQEHAKSQLEKV